MRVAFDPYAPPGAASPDALAQMDGPDLFVATLPSTTLRVATGGWVISGILLLFLAFRMVLAVEVTMAGAMLEWAHVVLGLLSFSIVWGLGRGSRAFAVLGFFLAPCLGLLSLFALLTGSLAGLFGLSLTCGDFVLTAVTMTEVGRIGRARRALAQKA